MSRKMFTQKATAVKYLKDGQILCNEDIKKYFVLDSYNTFESVIKSKESPNYYEFIGGQSPVNLFIDIEIYKDKHEAEFNNHTTLITDAIVKLRDIFVNKGLKSKFIVLSAHSKEGAQIQKRSYHLIGLLWNEGGDRVYFRNVKALKPFVTSTFPRWIKCKIMDPSVYREGLFRTYLSTKSDEDRPFVKDDLSDPFEFNETFVCYCPGSDANEECFYSGAADDTYSDSSDTQTQPDTQGDNGELIEPIQKELTHADREVIRKFVRQNYKYRNGDIREIILNHDLNCINVNLYDTFCFNLDREHKSNHQYIVIDTYSSKQKCHDIDCKDYKHNEIQIANFPKEVNEIILKCLKVNKREQELIERAIQDCRDYITKNFDENIEEIKFDRNEMVFKGNATNTGVMVIRGKCTSCKLEHHITNTGYCLKCSVCNTIYPKNQLIPVDDRYKNLNNFWMNYTQLVNNGTVNININNYYNGEEEFSCDIQLDTSIIKDKKLLRILNECLDGHKVTKLAQLMYMIHKEYIYTGSDWYYFDGFIWVLDNKSLNFKRHMLELCGLFNKIKKHYENKLTDTKSMDLIKNIKSIITKLNKPQLKDDILKEAQLFYIDSKFVKKLNSKKHLVPFTNGVYDLLENKFRKTSRDDYVNLTVGFEYKPNINNEEVNDFINQVLPNIGVKDYVLKKMSECLNGDIPNTNFLMFIGDGANGKSQLLNLMKLAMGELGEKVEVTLLTRKRNNANEANTEKIKLMNKRFAFLSEPEDGEKINIGLLKELTGSEEIVARGLYQESVSFVMEAKLFLACNELPEIKGEDTALWRRIRVIDFPSRFVEEPTEPGEFKIDKTLPSRMREDVTWRQTFIDILLKYYYKHVREPIEVQLKTNEYREENNDLLLWFEENIKYSSGDKLYLKDVCNLYFVGRTSVSNKHKSKLKKDVDKLIQQKFPLSQQTCQIQTIEGETFHGWKDFAMK